MTVPVPPDDRPQPAEPQPANPWAPPTVAQDAPPYPGGPYSYWPQPVGAQPVGAQPRNGSGVAALVLGIVGVLFGLALVLFWVAWLPALLAVVFGGIGLGAARRGAATNRPVALAGVLLGVAGLLLSIGAGALAFNEARSADRERAAAREQARAERQRTDAQRQRAQEQLRREEEARAADERARRLLFGGSYAYPDGLKVTMAPPTPFTPQEDGVLRLPKDATFVQLRVTVVNTGSTSISLHGSGGFFVKDAKGTLLFPLLSKDLYQGLPQSLAPGESSTALESYGIPNATGDPFSLEFVHGSGLDRKGVVWSGSPR